MNKQSNNGSSGSKTLSQQDKEMGFQLLLSPRATVNVLTPTVPHETAHLFPKLAGPNWTCYITGPTIRLGRRPEHTSTSNKYTNNKFAVDVDFCGNKQVSRRHADIKFNTKMKYWELRVYGRIGVKVNHNLITNKQKAVPLTSMAFLEIGENRFVFVLPDHTDGVPGKGTTQQTETVTTSATLEKAPLPTSSLAPPPADSQLDTVLENERNEQLVNLIVDTLKSFDSQAWTFTTEQLFKTILQICRKKSLDSDEYTMDAVLRALVFDSQFKVTKECLDMTAEQSDKVRWYWERPLSPPPMTPASFDASNSEAWSDFHYDFMDGSDHPTGETNENLSTTTGTPAPIDSSAWLPPNISEPTAPTTTDTISPSAPITTDIISPSAPITTDIISPSSVSTTTTTDIIPASAPITTDIIPSSSPAATTNIISSSATATATATATAQPPISTTTATNIITSPVLSLEHPLTEDEAPFSTTTVAPLSQTTSTTVPSIISRSLGDRTLSALSFSSIIDDGPISSPPFEIDPVETPRPSDRTQWTPLEIYHASAFPEQHDAISGYSRGLSLYHMYSRILAAQHYQPDTTLDESSSLITPCTLFPTTPDDDDGDEVNLNCSNRKRKLDSISDREDRTLWARIRTTVFKSRT